MINSLHRERSGSLPVCTEIYSFDFAGKSYPPFIEYALTHNQHVCPIYVHSHEEPELIHVLNGELDITTGGRRARLRKGETALISPHTAHGADFVPGCDFLEYCYLIFDLGILSGCGKKTADEITALRQGAALFPDKLTGTLSEKVGRNMLSLERLLFRQSPTAAGELEACACLSNIMSAILTEGLIHRGAPESRDNSFIELVGRYIDIHFRERLSTSDISAALGYNRNYFCALFRNNFGTTFIKYLSEYRVRRAADDYRGSSMSLPDIAANVGFGDYSCFSKSFTKYIGVTPTAYFKK